MLRRPAAAAVMGVRVSLARNGGVCRSAGVRHVSELPGGMDLTHYPYPIFFFDPDNAPYQTLLSVARSVIVCVRLSLCLGIRRWVCVYVCIVCVHVCACDICVTVSMCVLSVSCCRCLLMADHLSVIVCVRKCVLRRLHTTRRLGAAPCCTVLYYAVLCRVFVCVNTHAHGHSHTAVRDGIAPSPPPPPPPRSSASMLETLHSVSGMPWWGTIASGALLVRLVFFPLNAYSLRNASRFFDAKPDVQKLRRAHRTATVTMVGCGRKVQAGVSYCLMHRVLRTPCGCRVPVRQRWKNCRCCACTSKVSTRPHHCTVPTPSTRRCSSLVFGTLACVRTVPGVRAAMRKHNCYPWRTFATPFAITPFFFASVLVRLALPFPFARSQLCLHDFLCAAGNPSLLRRAPVIWCSRATKRLKTVARCGSQTLLCLTRRTSCRQRRWRCRTPCWRWGLATLAPGRQSLAAHPCCRVRTLFCVMFF